MKKEHIIDNVFTLVLFSVFAIMALLVTAAGASAYKSTSNQVEERFNRQTCLNYITARVHSNNEAGAVAVTKMGESDALTFVQDINGAVYLTSIYYYDGAVRELLYRSDLELGPDAGNEICRAQGLDFSLDGEKLSVALTGTDGVTVTAVVACLQ